jgi:hypothetical protein
MLRYLGHYPIREKERRIKRISLELYPIVRERNSLRHCLISPLNRREEGPHS